MLVGLILFTGGVLAILYTSFLKERQQEWYAGVLASIIFTNSGLYVLGNAFVHKVKADLIRRQRQKDQHKKYEFE